LKRLRMTIDNILKKRGAINKICEDRSGYGYRAERPFARRLHTEDWSKSKKFPEKGPWRSGGKSKEAGTSSLAEENWSKYRASTIVAVKKENKEKGRKPCAFCKGQHWNNQCSEYPDVKRRTKRAIEAKLCFNCLGTGHQGKDCKLARQNCYDCPYIETALANELGLRNDKTETLEISGSGSRTSMYKSQRVTIAVVLENGSLHPMEVNTMETLTAEIPSIDIKDSHALLESKQFDLGKGCWKKLRLLIGIDQYFHLINSQETEKLPSGFQLTQSMVGPIITGKGEAASRDANSRIDYLRAIVATGI
uniref:CCHC-type domain-containing protein n=1 Tax=Toxocara canis TaxID=6265 RepID=A0A183U7Z0_TOXCA